MAENTRMAGPPSSMAQQPNLALPVAPESARARAPPSVVRDDPHSCYTCNSFQDTTHKCKKPDQVQKVVCPGNNSGRRICHHIVGTHTNNKKVERNVVIAGCGSAPPVTLPEIETPIHSTFNGQEIKCTPFNYEHDDQGDAKRSNQAIKFMGTSCNCEGTLCNSHSEYSRHFTNSGIATKATSFFSVLSSVFGVVLFSLALRA
ncbi:hypothetical protein RvY_05819 [Ramazzottius varieornatus]|uniref:Uncharacterized protein n=1 Tax=Ramazzottius varieornatus TaxID=947166 RepID=A0A1D1UWD8_RAMVA|nr:hypothetical protein RvY_05819 [Ramazzottius varieornatus]